MHFCHGPPEDAGLTERLRDRPGHPLTGPTAAQVSEVPPGSGGPFPATGTPRVQGRPSQLQSPPLSPRPAVHPATMPAGDQRSAAPPCPAPGGPPMQPFPVDTAGVSQDKAATVMTTIGRAFPVSQALGSAQNSGHSASSSWMLAMGLCYPHSADGKAEARGVMPLVLSCSRTGGESWGRGPSLSVSEVDLKVIR